jgi:trk system potassium uptake protein
MPENAAGMLRIPLLGAVRRRPRHPAQVVAAAFAAGILIGTVLLILPASRAGPGAAPLHVATFTATSAVCVTGLTVVDTATYWSAFTVAHGRILERVGAHHVVYPEHDMGRRVAHLVTGRMIEFVQLDEGFALVELKPPTQLVGRSLADSQVRGRHGVTVVCIKPAGGSFTYATPDTVPDDVLVVAGETDRVEGFSQLD